jgi:hypothetical protein
VATEADLPFESLDFVYMPTTDVAAEIEHWSSVLGGEVGFAIEAFGTRVAMVRLASGPPDVLLAQHMEGERPVLLYRVASLDEASAALKERGWEDGVHAGMPYGEFVEFTTPAGHRLAIYERSRPEATERLAGRRDF